MKLIHDLMGSRVSQTFDSVPQDTYVRFYRKTVTVRKFVFPLPHQARS